MNRNPKRNEEYLKLWKEKEEFRKKFNEIENEFSKQRQFLADTVRNALNKQLKIHFSGMEDFYGVSPTYIDGYEVSTIRYSFNFGDLLFKKYKKDFGKKVNLRRKHDLLMRITYRIDKDSLNVGFSEDLWIEEIIKDEVLIKTADAMIKDIKNALSGENLDLNEFLEIVEKLKDIIDNYETYLTTYTLTNNL